MFNSYLFSLLLSIVSQFTPSFDPSHNSLSTAPSTASLIVYAFSNERHILYVVGLFFDISTGVKSMAVSYRCIGFSDGFVLNT